MAHDVRPFYQITHGPMEAHALGRGINLANELGVLLILDLNCKNYCKNYSRIGACRHPNKGFEVLSKNAMYEKHLIYCDNCFEVLCLRYET